MSREPTYAVLRCLLQHRSAGKVDAAKHRLDDRRRVGLPGRARRLQYLVELREVELDLLRLREVGIQESVRAQVTVQRLSAWRFFGRRRRWQPGEQVVKSTPLTTRR